MISVVLVLLLDMLLKRYVVMSLYRNGYFSVVLCVIVLFIFCQNCILPSQIGVSCLKGGIKVPFSLPCIYSFSLPYVYTAPSGGVAQR